MIDLVHLDQPVRAADDSEWTARILGRHDAPSHWIGWIEFRNVRDPDQAVHTDRETTQPNRDDLEYWATGLSMVYLEGALARALDAGRREPPASEPGLDARA